ncbi:penicillin-binding protein 1A [Alteromonadaceae bacterium Bs31]|nr:penicillin-binding protein 1A [Alteromonadaceae bacterium Bs31]
MKLKKPFFIVTAWLILAGTGGTLCVLAGMYLYLSPQLPSVESLRDVKLQTPLRVYSADKKLIAEFGEKRRTPIKFDQIPQSYIDALLSAEDDNFFEHNGVSLKGLMRASTQLLLTGRRASGGSTITMQVARNYYLSRRKTFARKFNEILLALRIEQELSKEEILELYVNIIFLGNRAYGIHAASQVYYGKALDQLSLAQYAMLAGLPKGPSTMNPLANPSRAIDRRNWILSRMLDLEIITQEQHDLAVSEPVTAKYHSGMVDVNAPYVAEMARSKAIELFGLDAYTKGYRVHTTVDSRLQNSARNAVVNGLLTYDARHGYKGPEKTLEIELVDQAFEPEDSEVSADEDATENTKASPEPSPIISFNQEEWLKVLKSTPVFGGLEPAAVTHLSEQSFTALLATGEEVEITWEQGISSARSHVNENARGPKPKLASEVVSIGDLIRLRQQEDGYHLCQIPEAQSSLVALNPKNGAILSLVGGFDFNQSHFNRAVQAKRQPGSNFKPFVYTAALENGMTPATIINDAPFVVSDAALETVWRPENSNNRFEGPTRLREALYRSKNLVSVRVLREIGIGNTIRGMSRFGFDEKSLPRDLSLALGSQGLTPMEVAVGYAVLANGGYSVQPYLIDLIQDSNGDAVYQALPSTVCEECDKETATPEDEEFRAPFDFDKDPFVLPFEIKGLLGILEDEDYPRAERILDERVAYIIDSMLKDVIQRGTGVKAKVLGRSDLGGKTGTSNGPNDVWFSGYNGNIAATTWVGFDQFLPLGKREYGGTAALPIWIDFMRDALKGTPETKRAQPPGVVTVKIDPETGERARPGDPDAIFEIFRSENAPKLQIGSPPEHMPYEEESLAEDIF